MQTDKVKGKNQWWEIQISHPTFLSLLKRKIAQNTSVMALKATKVLLVAAPM